MSNPLNATVGSNSIFVDWQMPFTTTIPSTITAPPTVHIVPTTAPTYNGPPPEWNILKQPVNSPGWKVQKVGYGSGTGPDDTIWYDPNSVLVYGPSNPDIFKTLSEDELKKEYLKALEKFNGNSASNPLTVLGDPLEVLKSPPPAPFDPATAELLKKLLASEWPGPAVEVKELQKASPEPTQAPQEAQELTGPFRRKLDLE